jgi:hypothetical protein
MTTAAALPAAQRSTPLPIWSAAAPNTVARGGQSGLSTRLPNPDSLRSPTGAGNALTPDLQTGIQHNGRWFPTPRQGEPQSVRPFFCLSYVRYCTGRIL